MSDDRSHHPHHLTSSINVSSVVATGADSSKQPAVIICSGCDLKVATVTVNGKNNAHCPRCNQQLYRGSNTNLQLNLLLTVTGLLFFIPTLFYPFLTIRLVNINFSATLFSGSYSLFNDGFYFLAALVFFCSVMTPLLVLSAVLVSHWALKQRHFIAFKYALTIIQHGKDWLMIDVFLLGIAISAFKLQEYADVNFQYGLINLICFQIVSMALIPRLSVRQYWQCWQPARAYSDNNSANCVALSQCDHCYLSQSLSQTNHHQCVRCHTPLHLRKPNSIQKTWAYLLAATICLFPANFVLISIIFTNGKRIEDTIFSGVVTLVETNMPGIAAIIFIASIVVPIAKILGLAYIMLCIHWRSSKNLLFNMKLYGFVKWIGKWSILDLFVISIMIALVDRDQILDFIPGLGAVAFAFVVVLTMLAAESLDTRLIWDTLLTKQDDQSVPNNDQPTAHSLNKNKTLS